MRESSHAPRYLVHWDYSRDLCTCRDVVTLSHRLADLSHFSGSSLSDLLDGYPREATTVATMGNNPAHPNEWRLGCLAEQSGTDLLHLMRRGQLQLTLWNLNRHQPRLGRIVERLCGEIMECQPGLRTRSPRGHLRISSPKASDYYQFESDPCIFWQIRGCSRIWVYPPRAPFLSATTIAQTLSQERVDSVYYEPDFDDRARVVDLHPGDALALPQHTPFRTENTDGVNLSLQTQYRTRESVRINRMFRADWILSRWFPCQFDPPNTVGIKAALKKIVIACHDLRAGKTKEPDEIHQRFKIEPTFRLDGSFMGGVGPNYSRSSSLPSCVLIASSQDISPTNTVAALET